MAYFTYIFYVVLSSSLIIWIGNICHANGKIFILNYFSKHVDIGNRINNLLRIAYYLLNIGLTIFCLYSIRNISSVEMIITEVCRMLGFIMLTIGILHFNNIILITLFHKHFKP